MNPLRKLGWTLLLTSWLTGACAPQGEGGTPARPRKGDGVPAPRNLPHGPAAQPTPVAVSDEQPSTWPWSAEEEDEFEGEGWSFWPLDPRAR